jgi:hypothetical protein
MLVTLILFLCIEDLWQTQVSTKGETEGGREGGRKGWSISRLYCPSLFPFLPPSFPL